MKRAIISTIAAAALAAIAAPATASNDTALAIYRALASDGNTCVSPYSILSAFAMTYAGARGETAAEMESALGFSPEIHDRLAKITAAMTQGPDDAGIVDIANSIWPRREFAFKADFKKILLDNYASVIHPQDFAANPEQACKNINEWVSVKTRGKITDIVNPRAVGPGTGMVLVNAVYFNSPWIKPFEESGTSTEDFFSPDGPVSCDMMNKLETVPYMEADGYKAIKMPYKYGIFSMTVVLPDEGVSLDAVEQAISADAIASIDMAERRRAYIELPKFKNESSFSLGGPMRELGVQLAFDPGVADFSGMNGQRDLYISEAVHKAFVEVSERGTEAAAATAITMRVTSIAPEEMEPPVPFRADRPFLWMIREETTGEILFIGKVVKP